MPNWTRPDLLKDGIAGLVAAVVVVLNIVAFGGLFFHGPLAAGTPLVIWSMLIGSCIGGVVIALKTTLPPLASGMDSPTGAVLVLLSAQVGIGVLAAGGTAQAAIESVMLVFTAATVVTGALLYAVGKLKLGAYFRFIPYFVVGGFLAATGWLLISGGVRMTSGRPLSLAAISSSWSAAEAARLASAVGVLLVLLALRRWVTWGLALPAALVTMCLLGAIAIRHLEPAGSRSSWYLPSLGSLTPWLPMKAWDATALTGPAALALVPQILVVSIVALISLVTKVAGMETARKCSANLDAEFKAHGVGSVFAAPFGGIMSGMQSGTSRLLEHSGGATRWSGAVCAIFVGALGLASLDLPGLVPLPVVAGLAFYLGCLFIIDALSRPLAQRAWSDLILIVAIMLACVVHGHLVGVIGGVIAACLLFAATYARVNVVRQHLSRAQFASYVDRSTSASQRLREAGDAIQLYWLSGYLFFGSSESVFERIQRDLQKLSPKAVRFVILDFRSVPGVDSSAMASVAKLRHECRKAGIALICCALVPKVEDAWRRDAAVASDPHAFFPDINVALAWCEDQLLAQRPPDADPAGSSFAAWIESQLGPDVDVPQLMTYLERRDVSGTEILYRQGDPADNIDLVAAGNLLVDIKAADGEPLRVRKISTHSVVGEMGFVRRSTRSATVSSDGAATIFTLSRSSFERMRREQPALALAFGDFLLRVMADRIEATERLASALRG